MSNNERPEFTNREMFLMRQAVKAGSFYGDIDKWLDTVISDAGNTVSEQLAHHAESVTKGWIKCSERLPEPKITVLVHYKSGNIYTIRKPAISAALNRVDGPHAISDRPTHWMPLPELPKQEQDK